MHGHVLRTQVNGHAAPHIPADPSAMAMKQFQHAGGGRVAKSYFGGAKNVISRVYAGKNGVSVYLSFPGALGKKLLGLQHKVSCSAMVGYSNFAVRHVVQQSFDAGTFVGLHACSAFLCAFRRTMNFN